METCKYPYDYEESISLKDLLATIFDKWLIVFIFFIIGALVGLGIYLIKSQIPEKAEVTEASIEEAREGLNIEQIEQVDYLYAQYKSYKDYRKRIQNYLAGSLYRDVENATLLRALYYVESDIHGVNYCYTDLAVGKEDLQQIADILGKDILQPDDIHRRITIENGYSDLLDGVGVYYEMSETKDEVANRSILRVTIFADNEEEANQMLAVVDAAFQKETTMLIALDPEIQFSKIGQQCVGNASKYLADRQAAVINTLNDANNQVMNLENNYINKLQEDEKGYFDAKKNYDEYEIEVIKKPSLKKTLLLGAVIGLVLGFLLVILWYIFNNRVKTIDDIAGQTRTDIPYVLHKKKSGFHLFGGVTRRLRGVDLSDTLVSQEMLASDLVIKLRQMNCSSAYLVTENHTQWAQDVTNYLQTKLGEQDCSIQIQIGNPLKAVSELHDFSQAEAVILMIQLKETRIPVMKKWIQLTYRYQRSTAGAVILEEC